MEKLSRLTSFETKFTAEEDGFVNICDVPQAHSKTYYWAEKFVRLRIELKLINPAEI
jgi:hypothetical protein